MNKQAYIELIEQANSKEVLAELHYRIGNDFEIGYYTYMEIYPTLQRKYSQLRWENEFKEDCF